MLPFNSWSRRQQFIDVFDTGKASLQWKAITNESWIRLSQGPGTTTFRNAPLGQHRLEHSPRNERGCGTITVTGAGATKTIQVSTYRPQVPSETQLHGAVQSAGAVSVEAENFTRMSVGYVSLWKRVEGLGPLVTQL